MKLEPPVRRGAAKPFSVSVCCWMDLLAYGSMISSATFNPMHPQARTAFKRLRQFQKIVAEHSNRRFPTLTINDGAAAYRDLSWRSNSVTYDFIIRAWKLFQAASAADTAVHPAGVRAVLAGGFRVRGSRRAKDAAQDHFKSVIERLQSGEISGNQAVREAASHRHCSDAIPGLQANFAFTKAYVAESSGRAGGLPGAKFYLDLALLSDPNPAWLDLGPPIPWRDERLSLCATFAEVRSIGRWRGAPSEGAPPEVRDGLELGQRLAPENDLLAELHAYGRNRRTKSQLPVR